MLTRVNLKNFRNYKQISINTDADLVLILGDNAAGKTNFLESIYFLSRLKSFRTPDSLLVKNLEDHFSLQGVFSEQTLEAIVQIAPSLKRQFKINDQKTRRTYWQPFSVVLFVSNDLNLFHLGPLLRRKFLDETLSQLDSSYSLDLESFDHVLKQKSALLEQIYQAQAQASELEFWNLELVPIAMRLTSARQKYLDFLNQHINEQLVELTGLNSNFTIQYKRIFSQTEAELLASLKEHEAAEIRSGKNLIGPHRDDFEIYKDGQLNLYNSSGGELRLQVLALKLLQAKFMTENGKKPIILLDDVFSELDETRRTKLLENLTGHQIFITSTEERFPKTDKTVLILRVENNLIQ